MEDLTMRILLAWGLGVLLLTGLAVGGDAKDDQKKLEGTWKSEFDGKKVELQLTKDKFTMTFAFGDQNVVFKGAVKIDPKKKPKEMDLTVDEGPDFVGKTALAIYEIDGDTFKWCANEPGMEMRPKAFPDKEGVKGDSHMYLVFKRAK
jgi:uncharacterized protein (TIGR03067 family)